MPAEVFLAPCEWPTMSRAILGRCAGYTAVSGSVTRALNGILPGSSSGDPHPGLLARGLVVLLNLDVEGISEQVYRITPAGVSAYHAYIEKHGDTLPKVKDAALHTNGRYK